MVLLQFACKGRTEPSAPTRLGNFSNMRISVKVKPQAKEETQALTKEDVQFLLDEKIVTQEEAKALLELDKLVPTN